MVIDLNRIRKSIARIVSESLWLLVAGFAGASMSYVLQYDGLRQVGGTLAAFGTMILLVGAMRLHKTESELEGTKEAVREAAYEGTKRALEEHDHEVIETVE